MAKKILVFCGGSYVFGAEIVTISVIKELQSNGFEVYCIVSGWNDGNFIKRLENLSAKYTVIKLGFFYITKPLWTLDTILSYPRAIYQVRKIMKNFKPDFIHHVSYRSVISAYPLIWKYKNYLFVFDAHYGKLEKVYFKILNKVTLFYIAVSQAIKLNLIEIGAIKERIEVIYNGIDLINPIEPKAISSIVNFGIVGQIIARKGHKYVVAAAALLKQKGLAFKLLIIGSGDEYFTTEIKEEIVKQGLTREVIFKSFITQRNEIYKDIDVVLVPSIGSDPLPTSAMEAGFLHKPTIVTNVGGLPEIVIHNKTGIIVEPASIETLASAMEKFIINPNLIKVYGKSANTHIREEFDVKKNILKLIELLNDQHRG